MASFLVEILFFNLSEYSIEMIISILTSKILPIPWNPLKIMFFYDQARNIMIYIYKEFFIPIMGMC